MDYRREPILPALFYLLSSLCILLSLTHSSSNSTFFSLFSFLSSYFLLLILRLFLFLLYWFIFPSELYFTVSYSLFSLHHPTFCFSIFLSCLLLYFTFYYSFFLPFSFLFIFSLSCLPTVFYFLLLLLPSFFLSFYFSLSCLPTVFYFLYFFLIPFGSLLFVISPVSYLSLTFYVSHHTRTIFIVNFQCTYYILQKGPVFLLYVHCNIVHVFFRKF